MKILHLTKISSLVAHPCGLTENGGHENDGPSKLQDMKLQKVKLTDQCAGHENAGHEDDGPICKEFAGHEIAGHENDGPNLQCIKWQNLTTLNTLALTIHAVCFEVTIKLLLCLCL